MRNGGISSAIWLAPSKSNIGSTVVSGYPSAVLYLSDPADSWGAEDHADDSRDLWGELMLYTVGTATGTWEPAADDDLGGSARATLAVTPVGGRLVGLRCQGRAA